MTRPIRKLGRVAVAAAALSCLPASAPGDEPAAAAVGPGDAAPDFALATVDGKTVRLSEVLEGSRGAVLWFT